MAIDQSKIGQLVTAQMEALEADYGDDCEIGDVCTIVEVVGPHGSHVRLRSGNPRGHVTLGLLRIAEQIVLSGMGPGTSAGSPDD